MFPGVESEMGLPLLISQTLPVAITGLIIASYFSAIMSTADSCLMASSGNLVSDVLCRYVFKKLSQRNEMLLSQGSTLVIGVVAVLIAWQFEKVLEAIMFAYVFMVSGLFVPTIGAFFWPRGSAKGAFYSMLTGGGLTLILTASMPDPLQALGLDPICYGLLFSALVYVLVSLLLPDRLQTARA
jgi:SSS family solute:Na+ symporter